MRVETKSLLEFLEADGERFSIPLFQRPYSWDRWQCEVLWRDLERTAQEERPHFFGAVFYREEADRNGNPSLSLIDGQQRTLTTLLLIAALAEHAEAHGELLSGRTAAEVAQRYLLPGGSLKVLPAQRDEAAFRDALMLQPAKQGCPCRAHENRGILAQLAADSPMAVDALWQALGRFGVVAIRLEPEDDAQAIFESFNSKGVPLVTADMVRNYLLLSESPAEQVRLYDEYWEHIQGLFGDDPGSLRLNNALRAWTVIRCKTPHAKSDAEAFEDFKQYAQNEFSGSTEDLMEELLSFCSVWAENYRYHAVKKFRSANWAKLGRKTLVSDRPLAPASKESRDFYAQHYGVNLKGESR